MKVARRRTPAASDAALDPRVLYVHGIGRQLPAAELKRIWDLALFGREMGEATRMVHWADVLHPRERTRTVSARASSRPLDVSELLAEAGVSPDDPAAQELGRAFARTMGVSVPGTRTRVLPLPGFLRKPIARAFMEALIRDSAAYFFRPAIRDRVRKRLRDELAGERRPVVLVAHSLGTVVTLEVLAGLRGSAPRIAHLVTLGSPLGIQEVQDHLSCDLVVPKVVDAWHNFADPFDPVALDKGIGREFEPDGFVIDELVLNPESRRLDGFDPHSAAGYLAHPKVRAVVQGAIRFDTHARFLLARDVAATLSVESRHPVLIEILEPGYPAIGESQDETKRHESLRERGQVDLATRIDRAARRIERLVGARHLADARVDRLRRFVAARLTPAELAQAAHEHQDLRIYAVWKSTIKRKLLQRSGRVLQADAAWTSYGALGASIRWAVLDTGVRSDHPHFRNGAIAEVWDCTEPGPPRRIAADADRDGHGTHVAGIIAGESPDGTRRGMAPRATLVVYKVLDDQGAGEDAWIIKALDHIAAQNESGSELVIHGVNLSLGGPYDATVYGCGFSPICVELRRLWRDGVLVCVASGNEGQVRVSTPDGAVDLNSQVSIGDPANLEDCIAVGSVNADRPHLYGVSSFSSRGPTADGRVKPDVVAPGERIQSCNARFAANQPDSLYREESGTSMAVPHVSGMLAAFLSVRREFRGRPDEVKQLLLRTCTDLGRDRYHQGHGVPNLMKMLLEA